MNTTEMEFIEKNCILEFNANTLEDVRKQFGLNDTKLMNESIDILETWLQKQDHFVRRNYPRNVLERLIIYNKGSVEKTKYKIEKLCKLRTTHPRYFDATNIGGRRMSPDLGVFVFMCNMGKVDGVLPQMTAKHERIYIHHNFAKKYDNGLFHYFRYILCLAEYAQLHDYNNGVIVVFDYRNADIFELLKHLNVVEIKFMTMLINQAYSMKLNEIHIISNNKAIDILIKMFKQAFSPKIGSRIKVHKTVETLYDYIPKDILPIEYGGMGISIHKIFENNYNEITSEAFIQYLDDMSKATVTEDHRRKVYPDTIGVAGTFRSINID